MKPSRTFTLRTFTLCSMLLVLVNGDAALARTHRAASPVTIVFWDSNNPAEHNFTKALVNQWNRMHKDIYVKLQPLPATKTSEEVFLAAIAAHKTPDITNNLLPAVVPQYSSEGGLYQLDKLPDFISYMHARMPTGTLEQYRSNDGHYYQVPWKANPVMIIYRPDLLKKAGISSFPRTYSTLMSALKAIKAKTHINPIFPTIDPTWYNRWFDFYCFYLAQSNGTKLLDRAAKSSVFQDHGAARVMSFWRQIYGQKLAPKSASTADKWKLNQEAMYIAGPWGPNGEVVTNHATQPWAVAPIPVPDGMSAPAYPYTYSDPKNLTIFGNTKHPKEAWEFIKWYTTPQHDATFLEATWEFPYRKQMVEDPTHFSPIFRQYPQLTQFAKQLPHVAGLDDTPNFVQMFTAISDAWESAVVNQSKSPDPAVKDAAKKIDGIVGNAGP
ncbi:MAG TPA: extracellular solute-binding protein [Chloroflexota bacterium]|nr:extracellular solute-binding protein [Chloroflexota bacterium]